MKYSIFWLGSQKRDRAAVYLPHTTRKMVSGVQNWSGHEGLASVTSKATNPYVAYLKFPSQELWWWNYLGNGMKLGNRYNLFPSWKSRDLVPKLLPRRNWSLDWSSAPTLVYSFQARLLIRERMRDNKKPEVSAGTPSLRLGQNQEQFCLEPLTFKSPFP